jgi:GH24 family phage-related lysozyme (muramidase)
MTVLSGRYGVSARLAAILSSFQSTWGVSKLKRNSAVHANTSFFWHRFTHELIISCKGGGKVLRGLVIRREAEAVLV